MDVSVTAMHGVMGAAMADDGAGKTGGKGPLGELVKAESMIQLAIALPAG